jgi:hypothetical protein
MDAELELIRDSLLRRLRVELGSDDGEAAFEQHLLLIIKIHKLAGLNQTVEGEGAGWRQCFQEHFPKEGKPWRAKDAQMLWEDWRVGMLKWETPKRRVTVTHGQPHLHWVREPDGTLCVDLESMWDDYEAMVASFLTLVERDPQRRAVAVWRWHERRWSVRRLSVSTPHLAISASYSATAMGPSSFR